MDANRTHAGSNDPTHTSGADDETKASASAEDTATSHPTVAVPPVRHGTLPASVGRYRIRRVIASGGMGTVYEATQDNPRRVVAVKVMRRGITSRTAMRRFEYEAQVLARLRHPGIAQVFDAGVHEDADGRVPYFAMEYVPSARAITLYAREQNLSTRDRLALFMQVCDAVHHGHQKGIIHRDLKPSNILVDADGQVKIIDFGVARSTDSDMALTTLQTAAGEFIGTLRYMSPEQCGGDPSDLDTRSDVYALGVVLYELLTGAFPYDLEKTPVFDAPRVIRESPPVRLGAIDRTLRGDVETIALKALEKERRRRYPSAHALAEDIARYLRCEPILAHPPSVSYKMLKFVNRRKTSLIVAILLVAALGYAVNQRIDASWTKSLARTREMAYSFLHAAQPESVYEEPQRVIEDCTRAIDLDPDLAFAYALRAKARIQTGDEDAARRDTVHALSLDPNNALAQRVMGYLLLQHGEFEKALEFYNKGLQRYIVKTDFPRDLHNRARLRAMAGDYQGALKDAEQAVGMAPEMAVVYIGRANIRRFSGDVDGAISDLKRAATHEPNVWAVQANQWIWEMLMLRGHPGDREAAHLALQAAGRAAQLPIERACVAMCDGGTPMEKVLAMAPNPRVRGCILYYAGAKALVENDRDTARTRFQESVAMNAHDLPEYDLAQSHLRQLDQQ